jgi:hypothetical protein
MSLYDKASLVLIPSGTKTGTVYSQKPTDGDGDFTFTRSTQATRVNSQGLIEKERGNLLLQSNNFDTTWTKADSMLTPVGGQSGYDGSSDAWKIQRSDSNARFIKQTISQSGVQTFSVYAKKGNVDYITLLTTGGNLTKGIFSLPTDGTGTNTLLDSDNIDANITHIGSGWYRVSITLDEPVADVRIYPSETGTAEGGSTTDAFVYIQDAQLEQGLVATDYIETTTAAVYTGITDNVPRLDYDGDCPSLLLEPQRTNLFPHSEYLNGWNTIQAVSIDDNTNDTLSPDGKYNASKVTATGGGTQRIYDIVSVASGSVTMSLYVKSGTANQVRLITSTGIFDIIYNLSDESLNVTNGSGTIESVDNDWYRISATGTSAGGTEVLQIRHLGDSASSEYMYWYGAQVEQGSYATSYIPTYGTSVTRNGEGTPFPSVYEFGSLGDGESGTLFIKTEVKGLSSDNRLNLLSQGGSGNWFWRGDDYSFFVRTTTTSPNFNLGESPTKGETYKIAIRKDASNNVSVFLNGQLKGTESTGTNNFQWATHIATYQSSQAVKSVVEFREALTDQECIDLTT